MDYEKELQGLDKDDLKRIGRRLNIPGVYKLRKDELVEAIRQCPGKEIKRALGLGFWQKHKKSISIGTAVSVIALIFGIWSHSSSQKGAESFDKRLIDIEHIIGTKIDDPKAVANIKEEYEKKLASMRETIAGLKGVDKKSKDEALAAFKKGDFSRAKKLFLEIREKERKRQQELNKEAAVTAFRLGDIAYLELDFTGALDYYLEAERLDPGNTLYTNEVGKAYYTLGKYTKAKEYFEKSLEINLKTYGEKHSNVATGLNNLGLAWRDLGDSHKAIGYYEQALAIDKEVYGERHPDVAKILNSLGLAWHDLGEARKAIGYCEQALTINKEVYGERHPSVAKDLNNLGAAWRTLGEVQKAIGYFEQALEIFKEFYGQNHPYVATILNNLGGAWDALGESRKAISYYEQALAIDKEVYGERHPSVARDLNNLGAAWRNLGEARKAIGYYEQALAIDKEVYGERHPNVAIGLNNLGSAWHDLGEVTKAVKCLEASYGIFREFYGEGHPQTKKAKTNLDYVKQSKK